MGLAEPKRKQIIVADPRNLNWAEDKSGFGFKMLAKMGWASGKGLGAKEDGVIEPVKAFKKIDNSGIGCKKTSVDNWLENADAFSDLLARLNEDEDAQSSSSNECSSFTREVPTSASVGSATKETGGRWIPKRSRLGKDAANYRPQDFKEIFGRRQSASENQTHLCLKESGQIVNSCTSLDDYFKSKLQQPASCVPIESNSASEKPISTRQLEESGPSEERDASSQAKKSSKKRKHDSDTDVKPLKKKKKSSKTKPKDGKRSKKNKKDKRKKQSKDVKKSADDENVDR